MAKIEQLQNTGQRLLDLRRKRAARQNVPGMVKNCEALDAEIARLEAMTLTAHPKE